jgi:hypothetical protein
MMWAMNKRVSAGPWLAVAAVLITGGCGGSDGAPAPTPVTTPVTVAPAPSPTPQAFVCPLPPMPRLNIICPRPAPVLSAQVDAAIAKTVREHPELFNLNDDRGGGSYLVLDRARYHNEVVKNLHAQNICAIVEVEEIAVKINNDWNEQYNIWISDGHIRKGRGAHITTCFPATF